MAKLKDEPFVLIGINSDPDLAKLKPRLQEEKITWRSFWDQSTSGPIAKAWNVHGWPTIYLLDKDGKIRAKNLREEPLEKAIDDLVAEARSLASPAARKSTGK
ncbi:MAG: TlpA disulfide reductase family protein [Planctomycetota bacterium]